MARKSSAKPRTLVIWAGRHAGVMGYSFAAKYYLKALLDAEVDAIGFDTDLLELVGPTRGYPLEIIRGPDGVRIRSLDPSLRLVVVYHERPDKYPRIRVRGRARLIGYSVFETTSLPPSWLAPMLSADEIWTASEFNRETFVQSGLPSFMVKVVPHCLDSAEYRDVAPMQLPAAKDTVLLSIVSNFNRKDLGLLLRAYYKEFTSHDPVTLVLKLLDNMTEAQFEQFVYSAVAPEVNLFDGHLPHVLFLTARFSHERMLQLYQAADIYVSTERGKGWDLPAMEAMALGKAVVGIDWGGSTAFMNEENSFLVPPSDHFVFADPMLVTSKKMYTAQLWPAVDERAVRRAIRGAYENLAARHRKGQNARRDIERSFTTRAVGRQMKQLLSSYDVHHFRGNEPAELLLSSKAVQEPSLVPKVTWEQITRTAELATLLDRCAQVSPLRPTEKLRAFKAAAHHWEAHYYSRNYVPSAPVAETFKECLHTPKTDLPRKLVKLRTAERAARTHLQEWGPLSDSVHDRSREEQLAWGAARRRLWGKVGPIASPAEESSRLMSLRDRYLGERIFILGNGPSLNAIDLTLLRDEWTFGVNKIYLLFDRIDWRPSFYTALDWAVTPDCAHVINTLTGMTFFFPERFRGLLREGDDVYWYWSRPIGESFQNQFGIDPSKGIPGRGSVLITAIQLAFHLGFREIFLVGVDAAYRIPGTVKQSGPDRFGTGVRLHLESTRDDDPNHFDPRYFGAGTKWHDPNVAEMKRMFRLMRKGVEAYGGRIFNATPGGELEEFDRVDFRSLFPRHIETKRAGGGAIKRTAASAT